MVGRLRGGLALVPVADFGFNKPKRVGHGVLKCFFSNWKKETEKKNIL